MGKANSQRGFTIIELMVTLAVAAILASIAAPSFSTMIQDNRLITQVNELQADLAFARSEAIKRNVTVTICPLDNATPRSCAATWSSGWEIFVDDDANGSLANNTDILRTHGSIAGGNTIAFTQANIIYTSTGPSNTNVTSTYTFCDDRGATDARAINISNTGRASLAQDSNNDGIVNGADTNNVTCP